MDKFTYKQGGRFEPVQVRVIRAPRRPFPWLWLAGVVLALVILALALYDVAPAMVWPFVVR